MFIFNSKNFCPLNFVILYKTVSYIDVMAVIKDETTKNVSKKTRFFVSKSPFRIALHATND